MTSILFERFLGQVDSTETPEKPESNIKPN